MSSRSFRFALGVTLGLVVGVSGCADEKPPINRVQANALQKSFFVGDDLAGAQDDPQFFYRGYVVDNSTSNSQVSVGTWSHVDRIRWEITEDALIGRKAYQIIEGGDDHALPTKAPDGTIVAKFKIESHFDVRRDYDPSTGEEKNVLVENTTDRPWYQREFMRVDWSTNQVVDPMWGEMFDGKVFGDITVNPETYTVTDPNSDDAPHFEGQNGYFDITNKYYLEPQAEFKDGDFSFPTCAWVGFLTGSATYECDAQEAKVRFSFVKVDDGETDFEPLDNTKASLDVVGNPGGLGNAFEVGVVTSGRQKFDPAYGYIDKNYKTFANIHNIWKKSHSQIQCFTNNDDNHNGTADECEQNGASAGAQCDVNALAYDVEAQYLSVQPAAAGGKPVNGLCTIPYREREIRPIAYWANQEMPADLQDQVNADGSLANPGGLLDDDGKPVARGAAEDIVLSWNQLLRQSVGYAREVECRRTGEGDRDACHSKYFTGQKTMVRFGAWLVDQPSDPTDVMVFCHNPVRSYDDQSVCNTGTDQKTVRTGDIRRNMMVYWPYDTRAPYGGIANWNGDPLTGRIIGGMALTVGRSVTMGAAFARDVLQVAMGDLTMNDIIENTPADTYQSRLVNGLPQSKLTSAEADAHAKATNAAHAASSLGVGALPGATPGEQLANFGVLQSTAQYDPASRQASALRFQTRVQPLIGSKLESDLVSPSWLTGALGLDPTSNVNASLLDVASPLRSMNELAVRDREDAYRSFLEAQGACFTDMDTALVGSVDLPGLSKFFKDKYAGLDKVARGDAIYGDLVKETFKGIELHEVGHSLGMLHQFASSWDSMNYTPQYWQIRTHDGQITNACAKDDKGSFVIRDGAAADDCLGPRYADPATPEEMGSAWRDGSNAESRPGIDYFANTSTMEYQFERFGESAGLGTYDAHAMKTLYGRVIETIDPKRMAATKQNNYAPRLRSQLNEQDVIVKDDGSISPVHYTELARQMLNFDFSTANGRCVDANDAHRALGEWRVVYNKVCAPTERDHAAWVDFQSDALPTNQQVSETFAPGTDNTAPFWHVKNGADASAEGSVRWFYRWGSSDNSYVHTNPSDAGADIYEVAKNTELKFEAMYPFTYFRRKNREYAFWNIPSRVVHGYFSRMRTYHWNAAFRSAALRQTAGSDDAYNAIAADDDLHRPYLMANYEAFQFLAKSVLMPQPGRYTKGAASSGDRSLSNWTKTALVDAEDNGTAEDAATAFATLTTSTTAFGVTQKAALGDYSFSFDVGGSRYIDDAFSNDPDQGGSWDYQQWMIHPGFQSEKAYAFGSLTNSEPPVWIPSTDYFLDPRGQYVNFYDDMPDAVTRLLGGVISNDWDTVGVHVDPKDPAILAAQNARIQTELKISGTKGASYTDVFGNTQTIAEDGLDTTHHKSNNPYVGQLDGALSDAEPALQTAQLDASLAVAQAESAVNAIAANDGQSVDDLNNFEAAAMACVDYFSTGNADSFNAGAYTGKSTLTLSVVVTGLTVPIDGTITYKTGANLCWDIDSAIDQSKSSQSHFVLTNGKSVQPGSQASVQQAQATVNARNAEYSPIRQAVIDDGSVYGYVTPELLNLALPDCSQFTGDDATDPTKCTARPKGSVVAFPNIGYAQQIFGTILAAAYSRDNTDDTIVNRTRIWIDGVDGNIGGEAIPNPADQVRFFNPASGFTYIARKYGTETVGGKSVDKGIGARMLQLANVYLAQTYKTTGQKDQFGGPVLALDDQGQPQLISEDLSQNTELTNFIKYVGFIDGVRQVGKVFGSGPL